MPAAEVCINADTSGGVCFAKKSARMYAYCLEANSMPRLALGAGGGEGVAHESTQLGMGGGGGKRAWLISYPARPSP